ncbi:hypothetical protein Hanom_Chr11g01015851 [Helianthus anomalus]
MFVISIEESKRLNAVESTFQDPEAIAKAIGNATKAVVPIAPSENGPTTEVTTSEALQLIQGAQLAGPLTFKEFVDGLIATDVKYTLIKTKMSDDDGYESSYNFVVSAEGITRENDYKVM